MSIFVDALYAANKLRSTHPAYFHTLATTPVSFHYINDGHHLHNDHPTIELSYFPDPADGSPPVKFVNYSPPFQAPLRVSTPPDFYDALEKFVEILEDPANKFEHTLQEGDIVVFDNRRTLHARTAFSVSGDEQGEGGVIDRWLKGCYLEADSVLDKARVLRGKS
jgi:alpha-ketoglutarate-dependent taurine dioxygenase